MGSAWAASLTPRIRTAFGSAFVGLDADSCSIERAGLVRVRRFQMAVAGSVRGLLQCLVAFSVGVYVGLFLVSTSSSPSSPHLHSDAAAGAHLHSARAQRIEHGAPKLPRLLESRGAGVSVVSSRNVRAHGRALTGAGDAGPPVASVVPSAGAAAAAGAAAVPAVPAVCAGFAMHPGKDIRGFDIDARSSSSATDCCNLCRSEQGGGGAGTGQADCTGFVFNVDRCWLKTGNGANVHQSLELLPSDRPGIVAGVAQSAVATTAAAAAGAGAAAVPVAAMAVQQAAQSPQTVAAAVAAAAAPAAVSPTLPPSAVPAATSPPVAPPTPPLPPASASLTSLQNLLLLGRGGVASPDRAAHRRFGKVELAACLKKHYGGSLAFGGDSQVRRQRRGWVGGWVDGWSTRCISPLSQHLPTLNV